MGISFVSPSLLVYSWVRMAVAAWSKASVKTTYLLDGSGYLRIGASTRHDFRYSNPD